MLGLVKQQGGVSEGGGGGASNAWQPFYDIDALNATVVPDSDGTTYSIGADYLEVEVASGLANFASTVYRGAWHATIPARDICSVLNDVDWPVAIPQLLLMDVSIPPSLWAGVALHQGDYDADTVLMSWMMRRTAGGQLNNSCRLRTAVGDSSTSGAETQSSLAHGIMGRPSFSRLTTDATLGGRGIASIQVDAQGRPITAVETANGAELTSPINGWSRTDDLNITVTAGRLDNDASGTVQFRPFASAIALDAL